MYYLYFDGASRGNPGPASYGFVIIDDNHRELEVGCDYIGKATNNVAEYTGIMRGLERAIQHEYLDLTVYGDSELIIKQLKKEYRTNSILKPYFEKCYDMLQKFNVITLNHVKRDKNRRADQLANIVLDNELQK